MSSKQGYFKQLNYTMANEDTSLEIELVREMKPRKVLAVCGSGSRSLPLSSSGCQELVCIDLAQEQLWLAELRSALILQKSHAEFLSFFGYPPFQTASPSRRKRIFDSLDLAGTLRDYFQHQFEANDWKSLLYLGKWERTFRKIAGLVRIALGDAHTKIFDFDNVEDQARWYRREFPHVRWRGVLALVGNASFFNALLYRGHFVKKNIPESHFDFYRRAYERIFTETLARQNYFAQMSFLGEVRFPEGVPAEARGEVFENTKKGLRGAELNFARENILEHLSRPQEGYDFVSLSDVPSYFSGNTEREFMQRIRSGLLTGACIVLRHYLRVPENMNLTGYQDITTCYGSLLQNEGTQMYRIQILRYVGGKDP